MQHSRFAPLVESGGVRSPALALYRGKDVGTGGGADRLGRSGSSRFAVSELQAGEELLDLGHLDDQTVDSCSFLDTLGVEMGGGVDGVVVRLLELVDGVRHLLHLSLELGHLGGTSALVAHPGRGVVGLRGLEYGERDGQRLCGGGGSAGGSVGGLWEKVNE